MAWTDIPNSDLDVNSPGKANAVFKAIRDNGHETRQLIVPSIFPEPNDADGEVSTSLTSYTTVYSFALDIPDLADFTGIQRRLVWDCEVKVVAPTPGAIRLQDVAAGVNSNEITNIVNTSWAVLASKLTLNFAAGLLGTTRTIAVQLRATSGGTAHARNLNRDTARLYY